MKTHLTFYKGLLGIFFVMLFLTTAASAQKCKVKSTFDEFISTTTVQGLPIVLGGELRLGRGASWDVSVQFMAKNDSLFVILIHSTSGSALHINEFSLKFDDGSFLTIKNGDFLGEGEQILNFRFEATIFPITRVILEKMSAHAVEKIRPVFAAEGGFTPEIEVKSKVAEQVQKNATCILEYKMPPVAKL